MSRSLSAAVIIVLLWALPGEHRRRRSRRGSGKTVWFFYTVKWGFQDEFLDLFQRNHYPILKEMEKHGSTCRSGHSCRRTMATDAPTGRSPWSSSDPRHSLPRRPKQKSSPGSIRTAPSCRKRSSAASSSSSRTGTCRSTGSTWAPGSRRGSAHSDRCPDHGGVLEEC